MSFLRKYQEKNNTLTLKLKTAKTDDTTISYNNNTHQWFVLPNRTLFSKTYSFRFVQPLIR
jgi:hypothetical protein